MKKELAMTNKDVELLIGQVDTKKQNGLTLPRGYSVSNAMNAAYLMLKDAEDKNGNKVLEVCSRESVANALMQMATQGLNPVKKQCYFVAYGNKCTLVPSYFGTLAILNRVENLVCQPVANIIYEGDVFELGYDLDTGEKKILKHETSLENMDNPIRAAYAIIRTEKETVIEVMTRNQLENAWGQGQAWQSAEKKGYKSKTHSKFGEEMAKKTVLNRACKKLINATDDSSIMSNDALDAFNATSENDQLDIAAESVAYEVKENANKKTFVPPEVIENTEPEGEVVEQEMKVDTVQQNEEIPDFMR